jgi:hypothetical protein
VTQEGQKSCAKTLGALSLSAPASVRPHAALKYVTRAALISVPPTEVSGIMKVRPASVITVPVTEAAALMHGTAACAAKTSPMYSVRYAAI